MQHHAENENSSWELPLKYEEMPPIEKNKALRACILKFLNNMGPSPKSIIVKAIGAPNPDSVKKALDYLTTTKQIYSDSYGARDTIYFPNGRLAHPLLQGQLKCGRTEYSLRTYEDRLTGRNLTITEYSISVTGERRAKGGIRLDLVDIEPFIEEIKRINSLTKNAVMVNEGLITR